MSIWIPLAAHTRERSRPRVRAELRGDGNGDWVSLDVTVDTGSDITLIPIEWVSEYGLALNLIELTVRTYRTSSGSDGFGFRGNVQVRLSGRQFSWPCLYTLPPAVTELEEATALLNDLNLARVRQPPPPAKPGSGVAKTLTHHVTTLESWMRRACPDLQLRPILLGRQGFLEDFEVLICSDYMQLTRRSRWRDWRRAMKWAVLGFLKRDE